MRVQIATRHCEVPERIVERTEEQIGRLERYDARISAAEVIFTEEKHTRAVEVILHVDRAEPVVARGEADSFKSALGQVVDRLGRRVRDLRSQHRDHQAPSVSERVAGG